MNTAPTILVVDNYGAAREAVARVLREEHYRVITAANSEQAAQHLHEPINLILAELAVELGRDRNWSRVKEQLCPETPVVIVTAHNDAESARLARMAGAAEFLAKPVDPEQLLDAVRKWVRPNPSRCAGSAADNGGQACAALERVLEDLPATGEVRDLAWRAARTNCSVLLVGEQGNGKVLLAKAIHDDSPRRDGPFIVADLTALPDVQVEGELFGRATGPTSGKECGGAGRLADAHRGSVLISQIGLLPATAQARLLQLLESGTLSPPGSCQDRPVDVRVMAASRCAMLPLVVSGRFGQDLYDKLNMLVIRLPPLRHCRPQISWLVASLLKELTQTHGSPPPAVDAEVLHWLKNYAWPGNVRQLRSCLEYMVQSAQGATLTMDHLPPHLSAASQPTGWLPK